MKRGFFSLIAVALAAATVSLSATSPARANHQSGDRSIMDCEDLYLLRNLFFKRKGLCFTRAYAVRRFGNAGCSIDSSVDLPMSQREKVWVEGIVRQEARMGCARDGQEGWGYDGH